MSSLFLTLFLLLVVHAVCDYPLQGDFLSKAKNHKTPIPGVPWYQAMAAHTLIHAGGVWVVTGSAWLALGELVAHFIIDDAKCRGLIGFNQDQAAHVLCKIVWSVLAVMYVC